MNSEIDRKIAVIFVADVVGYSKHMERDENATIKSYNACENILNRLLKKYKGSVFNTAGDSVLAEFPSAVNAVECGVAFQTEIKKRNQSDKVDVKLEFRLGINMGDVVKKEGNLIGDGVNIAARLEALAQPSGISISKSVYDFVVPKTKMTFNDLGVQKVKQNEFHAFDILLDPSQKRTLKTKSKHKRVGLLVSGSLAFFLIILVSLLFFDNSKSPQKSNSLVISSKPNILIMPIKVTGLNNDQKTFNDGLTKTLVSNISKNKAVRVLPSSISDSFNKGEISEEDLITEFGVNLVLNTAVVASGDVARVNIEVTSLDKNQVILSSNKNIDFNDMFKAQDDLAYEVLDEIQFNILMQGAQVKKWFVGARTSEQVRLALNWRNAFRRFTVDGYIESKTIIAEMVEKAKEQGNYKEENFYVLNAWQTWMGIIFQMSTDVENDVKKVFFYVNEAVKYNPAPNTYIARALIGMTLLNTGCEAAIKDVRLANSDLTTVDTLGIGSNIYGMCGNRQKAIELANNALKLVPVDTNWTQTSALAARLFDNGQIDEIYRLLGKKVEAVDLPPNMLALLSYMEYKKGNNKNSNEYFSRAKSAGYMKRSFERHLYNREELSKVLSFLESQE